MTRVRGSVLVLLIVAAVATLAASLPTQPASAQRGLFSDPTRQPDAPLTSDPTAVRTRYVDVNFNMLSNTPRQPADTAGPDVLLLLDLFPTVSLTAVRQTVVPSSSGQGIVWSGVVQGASASQVTLVAEGGVLVGDIQMPGAYYRVRYAGNGVHAIDEVDPRRYPSELRPRPVSAPFVAPRVTAAGDDGSVIDVMVVYTPGARTAAGGTTGMNTLIDLAITETNQSYANSGITQRVRLVNRAEVSGVDESTFETALDQLTNPSDGVIDNVHTLRNQFGADLVSLFINNTSACGLAWQMVNVSAAFAPNGFSVVHYSCATGNYSFGHEMGHNMGAMHDRGVAGGSTGAFPYSFGFVAPNQAWRTVMAYGDTCGNCPRVQYWSNPGVNYPADGQAMGVAAGSSSAADNHLTLNNTAFTVANFRTCVVAPCGGTTATNTPTATLTPTATRTVTGTPPTSTPTRTPTVTATRTSTVPATPFPQPNVAVQVTPTTAGRLQVSVRARDAGCSTNNQLVSLQFTSTTNATVDIGSTLGRSGNFTVSVAPGTAQLTFFVNRISAGQATHVNLTVTDGCGSWPTFVGGGSGGF